MDNYQNVFLLLLTLSSIASTTNLPSHCEKVFAIRPCFLHNSSLRSKDKVSHCHSY